MNSPPILIVDDNPDACAMTAKLLWAFEYQADVAYDAFSALELVERKPYSMVIIDYELPGMNGVELFRRMHALRPEIKGIFVTGHTTIDVVYPAIQAGIIHVLAKPIDIDALLPVVEECLSPAK